MNKERALLIHCARVYIAQARAFRLRDNVTPRFAITLLAWAAKRRREAAAMSMNEQRELFAA